MTMPFIPVKGYNTPIFNVCKHKFMFPVIQLERKLFLWLKHHTSIQGELKTALTLFYNKFKSN